VAVLVADLIGQCMHLLDVKVIDGQADANTAKLRDQFGRAQFPTLRRLPPRFTRKEGP